MIEACRSRWLDDPFLLFLFKKMCPFSGSNSSSLGEESDVEGILISDLGLLLLVSFDLACSFYVFMIKIKNICFFCLQIFFCIELNVFKILIFAFNSSLKFTV